MLHRKSYMGYQTVKIHKIQTYLKLSVQIMFASEQFGNFEVQILCGNFEVQIMWEFWSTNPVWTFWSTNPVGNFEVHVLYKPWQCLHTFCTQGLWELAERLGEVRRRGISEDQLNQLPTLKFKSPNVEAAATGAGSTQCQICLVDFENGDCLRCIPCKHDFHKDCIDEWLKVSSLCGVFR